MECSEIGANHKHSKRMCIEITLNKDKLSVKDFGDDYFHGVGSCYPKEGYESLFNSVFRDSFSRILDFIVSQKGFQISLLDVG